MVMPHFRCDMAKIESLLPPEAQNELRPERIGARLALLREALGYRPAEMADALGIERTYWSRFEGGKRAITESIAARNNPHF